MCVGLDRIGWQLGPVVCLLGITNIPKFKVISKGLSQADVCFSYSVAKVN